MEKGWTIRSRLKTSGENTIPARSAGMVFSPTIMMTSTTVLPNPLDGAWELVSGSYLGDDQALIDYEAAGIKSLKVLSDRKFSFVTTAKGVFYAAGGGDYHAENGRYVESPLLASHEAMLGRQYEFDYHVEGDLWTNSRWLGGVRVEHETWRKVR